MSGKSKNRYGVVYVLVDGNETDGSNLYGYCKSHHGLLSYPLACVHRCMCREEDGSACRHFIKFERYDNRYKSALKGEEFRNSLGKKGVRKGERKKRKAPDAMSEVAEIPCGTQIDHSDRSVEPTGDLPAVGQDIRFEGDGVRNRDFKDHCDKCFWRKMYGRVVQSYFYSDRNEG